MALCAEQSDGMEVKMEKIKESFYTIINTKITKIIINILFGISLSNLTLILIEDIYSNTILKIALILLSFIISQILCFKFNFLIKTFQNVNRIILFLSIILGIFTALSIYENMLNYAVLYHPKLYTIVAVLSIVILLYCFYKKVAYYFKKYIHSLDKIEKYYLIISMILLTISTIFLYNITNVFHFNKLKPEYYDYTIEYNSGSSVENIDKYYYIAQSQYNSRNYNVLYSSDTQWLLNTDVFNSISEKENDIRQPLFGLFSIPFSIVPKTIAMLFSNNEILYSILLAIVQGFLVLIGFTLIGRLMKLNGISKVIFLIFLTISFPSLLFLLNLEQYVFAVFYMIVFIYMCINKIKDKNFAYIMATGSMITSGIMFPLLCEKNNIKKSIQNFSFTFLKCLAIFIVSARILLILPEGINSQINTISTFSKSENINFPIAKYTNFLEETILFSDFNVIHSNLETKVFKLDGEVAKLTANKPQIIDANTNTISIIGIIFFAIALIGFILNRHDKYSQISLIWLLFSLILFVVLGWGKTENDLVLYIYYFSWAIISLIYKFIDKIFNKHIKLKIITCSILLFPMLIINLNGMIRIIQFGIQYYS